MGAAMTGMALPRRGPPGRRDLLRLQRLHAAGGPPGRAVARPTSSTRGPTTRSGLGEDGPTHQPVEHLASLRAMPGLRVIRPADANETRPRLADRGRLRRAHRAGASAARRSRSSRARPTAAEGVARGGYVLVDAARAARPTSCSSAPGSEVTVCVGGGRRCWRGPTATARAGPGGVAAVVGAVRAPGPRPTATRSSRRRPHPGRRGGGLVRLGALRRRRRRHRPLRRLGSRARSCSSTSATQPRTWPPGPGAAGPLRPSTHDRRRRAARRRAIPARREHHDQAARPLRAAGPEPVARQPPARLPARRARWPSSSTRASGA